MYFVSVAQLIFYLSCACAEIFSVWILTDDWLICPLVEALFMTNAFRAPKPAFEMENNKLPVLISTYNVIKRRVNKLAI